MEFKPITSCKQKWGEFRTFIWQVCNDLPLFRMYKFEVENGSIYVPHSLHAYTHTYKVVNDLQRKWTSVNTLHMQHLHMEISAHMHMAVTMPSWYNSPYFRPRLRFMVRGQWPQMAARRLLQHNLKKRIIHPIGANDFHFFCSIFSCLSRPSKCFSIHIFTFVQMNECKREREVFY